VLPAQHTALAGWAVGLRQKTLRQRFLIATTAQQSFSAACSYQRQSEPSAGEMILRLVIISGNEWLKIFSESAIIRVIRG
jgi:hypothetical protein